MQEHNLMSKPFQYALLLKEVHSYMLTHSWKKQNIKLRRKEVQNRDTHSQILVHQHFNR